MPDSKLPDSTLPSSTLPSSNLPSSKLPSSKLPSSKLPSIPMLPTYQTTMLRTHGSCIHTQISAHVSRHKSQHEPQHKFRTTQSLGASLGASLVASLSASPSTSLSLSLVLPHTWPTPHSSYTHQPNMSPLHSQSAQAMEDGDWMGSAMALWTTPFMPNLLNTCVFLVETSQCIAVLLVNYKGRPWMKGLTENHALFLSVFACVAGCAACAWGLFPELNALIHLEEFPNDPFRWIH